MDTINILFKEYDTLRAEIISRTNNAYQLVTVGAALFAALLAWLGSHQPTGPFWASLSVAAAAFVVLTTALVYDNNTVADRLQELESEINTLAGTELLKWQTHRGGGMIGRIGRVMRRRRK